jgi:hypothetical protein
MTIAFLQQALRLWLFTGKGGAGKISLATAARAKIAAGAA